MSGCAIFCVESGSNSLNPKPLKLRITFNIVWFGGMFPKPLSVPVGTNFDWLKLLPLVAFSL